MKSGEILTKLQAYYSDATLTPEGISFSHQGWSFELQFGNYKNLSVLQDNHLIFRISVDNIEKSFEKYVNIEADRCDRTSTNTAISRYLVSEFNNDQWECSVARSSSYSMANIKHKNEHKNCRLIYRVYCTDQQTVEVKHASNDDSCGDKIIGQFFLGDENCEFQVRDVILNHMAARVGR